MPYLDGIEREQSLRVEGARVGRLVGVDGAGLPLVVFDDNPSGPVAARVAVPNMASPAELIAVQASVVLVFENGDSCRPLIVGVISCDLHRQESHGDRSRIPKSLKIEIDGQVVAIEAQEQVTLRCGAASLTLRKDGKILLSGSDVTSWATRTNKIKGGSVRIN